MRHSISFEICFRSTCIDKMWKQDVHFDWFGEQRWNICAKWRTLRVIKGINLHVWQLVIPNSEYIILQRLRLSWTPSHWRIINFYRQKIFIYYYLGDNEYCWDDSKGNSRKWYVSWSKISQTALQIHCW